MEDILDVHNGTKGVTLVVSENEESTSKLMAFLKGNMMKQADETWIFWGTQF